MNKGATIVAPLFISEDGGSKKQIMAGFEPDHWNVVEMEGPKNK